MKEHLPNSPVSNYTQPTVPGILNFYSFATLNNFFKLNLHPNMKSMIQIHSICKEYSYYYLYSTTSSSIFNNEYCSTIQLQTICLESQS